jgi:hypothetical protein
MRLLLIYLSILGPISVSASLFEQELDPVTSLKHEYHSVTEGRTFNNHKGARVLASKKKTYPFLDQLEELLYPGQKFSEENPGNRMERLEIAVFGNKQSGNIPDRVSNLRQEIENWQLANAQALDIINSRTQVDTKNYAYYGAKNELAPHHRLESSTDGINYNYQASPAPAVYSQQVYARPRRTVDYDYQNYRLAAPLMQNLGRRGIESLFNRR